MTFTGYEISIPIEVKGQRKTLRKRGFKTYAAAIKETRAAFKELTNAGYIPDIPEIAPMWSPKRTWANSKSDSVAAWYHKVYPTDNIYKSMNPKITFEDIKGVKYPDEKLGVGDSVVRDRVLDEMKKLLATAKGAVTKTAKKTPAAATKTPKKTVKTTEVPKTGLVVLKFVKGKTNHLVGIAPTQLSVVKQAFTSVKCNQASVSLSPSKMTITAIDREHVSIVKLTVPVRTGSGLKCEVDPSDFVKPVAGNEILCLDYEPRKLDKTLRDYGLTASVKAQTNAKAIRDMLAPYSTGKNGKFYRVTVEIGAKSRITATDEDHNPISTSVPIRKLAGAGHTVMSYYQTGYIYNALKIFGSASIVVGMKGDYHPIAISGINKGVRIEYMCAPVIDND